MYVSKENQLICTEIIDVIVSIDTINFKRSIKNARSNNFKKSAGYVHMYVICEQEDKE